LIIALYNYDCSFQKNELVHVQLLHDVEHHSGSLTWSIKCDYIHQIVATLLLTVPLIIKAIICDKYETYMHEQFMQEQ